MNHVIEKLESWLAHELSATESASVEEHLRSCSQCSARAQELRKVWDLLGSVENNDSTAPSIWPVVKTRTVGKADGNQGTSWFFGGGQTLRAGLAVTAVAAGLSLAFILPAGQQIPGDLNSVASLDEDSDMDWLADSTVFSSSNGGILDDLWLGTGLDDEGDGS